MSILTLVISFEISGVLLAAILGVIELHCLELNICCETLHKFKTFFKNFKAPLKRHFFCTVCYEKLESTEIPCPKCKKINPVSYFIEIPILYQLATLFKRSGFYDTISTHRFNTVKKNVNNYEDIYDGEVYKSLGDDFINDKSNIIFTWNSDGVPIFKSSKFAIWPFF